MTGVGKGVSAIQAKPLIPGINASGSETPVISPADHRQTGRLRAQRDGGGYR